MPKIPDNENIIGFLIETGLGSYDIHKTVEQYKYRDNYINPENVHGMILPIFQLPHLSLDPTESITLQRDQHNPYYEPYYLSCLAKHDPGLAKILKQYDFVEKFVKNETHYEGKICVRKYTVNDTQESFSDFIQALADHFDQTRYGYCSYHKAIYNISTFLHYSPDIKDRLIMLLADIRNTAIEFNLEKAKNLSHLFPKEKLTTYHNNIKELEKLISHYKKEASSHINKSRLWNALRLFLWVVKTVFPIKFMRDAYNNVEAKKNIHKHSSHAPERLRASFALFQTKIDSYVTKEKGSRLTF